MLSRIRRCAPENAKADLAVLLQELEVADARAAHRADGLRVLRREHREIPSQSVLDLLEVDDVGRDQPGVRMAELTCCRA